MANSNNVWRIFGKGQLSNLEIELKNSRKMPTKYILNSLWIAYKHNFTFKFLKKISYFI